MPKVQAKREKIYVRLKPNNDLAQVLFEFAIGKPEVFMEKSLQKMDFEYFCKVNHIEILN